MQMAKWCCSGSARSVGARRQSHNQKKKRQKVYVEKNGTDDDGDGGGIAAAASKPLSRTMNDGPTMVVCKKKYSQFL